MLRFERGAVIWSRQLTLIGGGLLLGVALVTVSDALLRYSLGRPIRGTFEATELLLAAIIFFGMPYMSLIDGHVSVDFLTSRLGPRTQHAIIAINATVCAVLLVVITVQMSALAREFLATGRTTITMRIPVFSFIVPVTAAAGLAAIGFVIQAAGAGLRALRPQMPPFPTPRP
jgi:TRAP-type C4-dicarboxylate transport system permease small subunit